METDPKVDDKIAIGAMGMRALWVWHNPSVTHPVVAETWVASFWPWVFYHVQTIQLKAEPDQFFTYIKGTNTFLWKKADCYDLLFEREYSKLLEAQIGHKETVDLLAKGKLKLSYLR